jgi:hypothetical protein
MKAKTLPADKTKTERDALVGLCQSLIWARGGRSSSDDLVREAIAYLASIGEAIDVK